MKIEADLQGTQVLGLENIVLKKKTVIRTFQRINGKTEIPLTIIFKKN